jgi:hypothetical protein
LLHQAGQLGFAAGGRSEIGVGEDGQARRGLAVLEHQGQQTPPQPGGVLGLEQEGLEAGPLAGEPVGGEHQQRLVAALDGLLDVDQGGDADLKIPGVDPGAQADRLQAGQQPIAHPVRILAAVADENGGVVHGRPPWLAASPGVFGSIIPQKRGGFKHI